MHLLRNLCRPAGALRAAGYVLATATLAASTGCTTHHWAQVESSDMPPPPGEKVLHTSRVVVHVTQETGETQCVAYERYSPICYHNIRPSLERGLARTLWPSFPEVVIGAPEKASPSDYVLQVDVVLDALPPDDHGPGWSTGARTRYRLMREGKVLLEETLASRSRADFPYGQPLGDGASEVVDASIAHISSAVSQVSELHPDAPLPLPVVAARKVDPAQAVAKEEVSLAKKGKPSSSERAAKTDKKSKSAK